MKYLIIASAVLALNAMPQARAADPLPSGSCIVSGWPVGDPNKSDASDGCDLVTAGQWGSQPVDLMGLRCRTFAEAYISILKTFPPTGFLLFLR